ncbi:MAG: hypothetical protein WBO04_15975 [Steroidobacteraceae bacterium]
MRTTLVLWVGNTLLGDDGAGVHAARWLSRLAGDRPGLGVLDGLIVFDAARLGGSPGSVRCFESAAMDEFPGQPRRSAHEAGHGCLGCSEPGFRDWGGFYRPLSQGQWGGWKTLGAAAAAGVVLGAATVVA